MNERKTVEGYVAMMHEAQAINPQAPWRTIVGHAANRQIEEWMDQRIERERTLRRENRHIFGLFRWRYWKERWHRRRCQAAEAKLQRLTGGKT